MKQKLTETKLRSLIREEIDDQSDLRSQALELAKESKQDVDSTGYFKTTIKDVSKSGVVLILIEGRFPLENWSMIFGIGLDYKNDVYRATQNDMGYPTEKDFVEPPYTIDNFMYSYSPIAVVETVIENEEAVKVTKWEEQSKEDKKQAEYDRKKIIKYCLTGRH